MNELKTPTPDELRLAYDRDLAEAFPPQELKPLKHIERMTERGFYYPLCLRDGGEIIGECFLWAGRPGWLLLDYLCVTRTRRNAGLGAYLLDAMRARFEALGVSLKVERGKRVYPVSDRAFDISGALEKELKRLGVRFCHVTITLHCVDCRNHIGSHVVI